MKGKIVVIGDMNVDGEELRGVFVECSVEELRGGRNLFGEEVKIEAINTSKGQS